MYLSLSVWRRAGGANKNDDANNGGNQSAARAASLGRKTPVQRWEPPVNEIARRWMAAGDFHNTKSSECHAHLTLFHSVMYL